MKRKFLTVLLVILSVLSFSFGLVACKDKGDGDGSASGDSSNQTCSHEYQDDYTCHDRKCSKCDYISVASTEHYYVNEVCGCGLVDTSIEKAGFVLNLIKNGTEYEITRYTGSLTSVEIPKSFKAIPITTIGEYAFSNLTTLKNIKISNVVTSISFNAFYKCSSLTGLNFENDSKLVSVGSYAFEECTSLVNVNFPNGLTTIEKGAFWKCSSLKSISLPDTLTSVGTSVFNHCNSLEYNVSEDEKISYLGNSENKYVYLVKVNDKTIESIAIDKNCKVIGDKAFYGCTSLKSMTLPFVGASENANKGYDQVFGYIFGYKETNNADSVEGAINQFSANNKYYHYYIPTGLNAITILGGKIDSSMFKNFTSFTSITIGEKVTEIGNKAFSNFTALENVTFKKDSEIKTIGEEAFKGCSALNTVAFEENCKLEDIKNNAFNGCSNITTINIPDSVTSIGNYAFYGCSKLTSIDIPASVNSIGILAFDACSLLNNINVVEENAKYKSIVGNLYSKDGKTLVQYVAGKSETSFTVPNEVTKIGNYAFYRASNLTEIVIPDSVVEIGTSAFTNCFKLASISISDKVTTIGDCAFMNCGSLASINVVENNANYKSIDGSLYSKDGKILIQYAIGKADTSFTVPDEVTNIGNYAFYGAGKLINVVSNKVKDVGSYAFAYSPSIANVQLSNDLSSIGAYAFSNCSNLVTITIPEKVDSIGMYAFTNCSSLASINVADNNATYKTIDGNLYSKDGKTLIRYAAGKTSSTFTISSDVTTISSMAFAGCTKLSNVYIPTSVTTIGDKAFDGCTSLTLNCASRYKLAGWSSTWNSSNRPINWEAD